MLCSSLWFQTVVASRMMPPTIEAPPAITPSDRASKWLIETSRSSWDARLKVADVAQIIIPKTASADPKALL